MIKSRSLRREQSPRMRMLLLAAVVVSFIAAWQTADMIQAKLRALPVYRLPATPEAGPPMQQSEVFPVWVRAQLKRTADVATEAQLKAAFEREVPPPVKEVVPIKPDYTNHVRELIRLEGIGVNGAYFGGRFYQKGERLPFASVLRLGESPLVPVLAEVQPRGVLVAVDGKTLHISLPEVAK